MAGRNKQKKKNIKHVNNKFINTGSEKKSRDGSFMIFGRQPILEELKNNPEKIKNIYVVDNANIEEILELVKKNKIRSEQINSNTSISKVGKVNHQGIIANIEKYDYADQMDWEINIRKSKKNNLVLVLDKLEDVGNFGALIRSAAAVGVSAIFIASDKQAPVNGTVFKTSAGNISKVKIIKVPNINQIVKKLKELKFWTYAVDMPENSKSGNLWEQKFDSNTALILGGEGSGVSQKIKENCDFVIPIPMENEVESLNVSVSGAIAMYEWKRQQK